MPQRRLNEFSEVSIVKRDTYASELGSFSVLFDQSINFGGDFYQDSISIIKHSNTIKGMHFQSGRFAQAKLITVIQGGIIDFFVDLRKDSSTFLDYGSIELNSENNYMLLIPKGFAHGYFSTHEDTIISYKLDAPYSPDHEYTLLWSDPAIGIKWPTIKNIHISSKDRAGLNLPEIEKKL